MNNKPAPNINSPNEATAADEKLLARGTQAEARRIVEDTRDPLFSVEASNIALSTMGHDLRTPLNAILGYSEMLQEEAKEQELEGFGEDLAKISSAAKNLLSLINGFLDCKAEIGSPAPSWEGLDPASTASHEHIPKENGSLRSAVVKSTVDAGSNEICVLVIDDDPAQRDIMRRLLVKEGFCVQTAANGPEGLKLARKLVPVAITLDVVMPEMDGWAVLESLKSEPTLKDVPVIMLTNVDDPERGQMLGADGYATKPVDRTLMVQTMRRYADRRREINEQMRHAAAAARKNEELFSFAMRNTPQKLFTADSQGAVDYLSPQWMEFAGLPYEELVGWGWMRTIHPQDADESLTAWRLSIESGEPLHCEQRIRRADGVYRWHVTRAHTMLDDEGKIVMWVGSNTEVHEQKEQAEELERRVSERTAQLELANSQMEGFTYTIAHDLRAPLRAIVFNSKVLSEELGQGLSEEHHEMLTRQAVNANKLAELIDELLKFSRLFRQNLTRVPLNITKNVNGVLSDMVLLYPACTEFEIQEGMVVEADESLVRFLFMNLLENACKFSPKGGLIEVGVTEIEGEQTFFVRDCGIGFNMVYLKKIFLPFERLVTEDQFTGTGIGLANVQRIVQLHSGRIWAESELGKGSTFFFTLAAASAVEKPFK